MTEKESKNVRVGGGRYDWTFESEEPQVAGDLVITIEAMQVLPPGELETIFAWLRRLSYPWSCATEVAQYAPRIELLAPVLQYIGRRDGFC